ncbi:fimbrial biogenesis outer membrane usher protein [Enterobacteriaceae bacterium H11S18]|uniref:fimbria/pilus outer membrane usher protein n=1 Tax=Dryocola clanedunensis TaxID=2925396 RepID=UPI0022F0BC18|nr:fimbria/pilus outer membrane usher protein [Dryocola clanedunensis]MCT4710592.1 fimbrial biogenesis outer membrane usher protein [Dryocola clanedunensis]
MSRSVFRRSPLSLLITGQLLLGISGVPTTAQARETFNLNALEIDNPEQQAVDLTQFAEVNSQAPGNYRVSVFVNGEPRDSQDVNFVTGKDGNLQAQLTPRDYAAFGVRLDAFPPLKALPATVPVDDIGRYIPLASATLTFNTLRLDVSLPQAAMKTQIQGAVDPKTWDQGIPALFLNYSMNGSQTRYEGINGGQAESYYANLQSVINMGAWRLRNYSTWNTSSGEGGGSHFDSINSFLQRDFQAIQAQLTLGQSSSPSEVFDSVQFTGVQLESDDNMLPDSLRGFAPVIRGIANSNARVTVRQNGYVIYQSYVSPGAFTIRDLYPTSSSGDLNVTITESDGSERSFVQPFSAVPIMQREGRLKFAVTGGQYRSSNDYADDPWFGQGTLIYGVSNLMTLYGGVLGAANYDSAAGGAGFGLGAIGSLSADITWARSQLANDTQKKGQSYRLQYARDWQTTGTSLTLAAYRYSTEGFYTFQEVNEQSKDDEQDVDNMTYNKKQKLQLDITQNLGDAGSLFLSAWQQTYWLDQGYERSLSAGYSGSYNGINYGFTYTYSQNPGRNEQADRQLAFSIQLPLDRWLSNSWANYSVNTSHHGRTLHQLGMSGTALGDNNLSYAVQESYGNRDQGNTGNVTADYKGTYGEMSAGYNYDDSSRQVNYGLQGSIVAHQYGVTLGQPIGDAIAIVRAPGASGASIQNNNGVKTDWRGYAVVPYVNAYKQNRIALDTTTLGEDVDVDTQTQTVIPTKGAVVLADFRTRVGRRVLMTLLFRGKPVPFGATASSEEAASGASIVGDDGQVYLTGIPETGNLLVKWGKANNQRCRVAYSLPENVMQGITSVQGNCL